MKEIKITTAQALDNEWSLTFSPNGFGHYDVTVEDPETYEIYKWTTTCLDMKDRYCELWNDGCFSEEEEEEMRSLYEWFVYYSVNDGTKLN